MSERQLNAHTLALMMKISVITGWQLPESEEYSRIFKDQLRKKMQEDYQRINIDEFEYALRAYGTQIKDWGKSMNLSLIDEAIGKYTFLRRQVSEYEEKVTVNLPSLPPGATDWSDEWERIQEKAKVGDLDKIIITTAVYDWLDREGKINLSVKEKENLMDKAKAALLVEYKDQMLYGRSNNQREIEMLESGVFNEKMKIKIINRAKVLALKMLAIGNKN